LFGWFTDVRARLAVSVQVLALGRGSEPEIAGKPYGGSDRNTAPPGVNISTLLRPVVSARREQSGRGRGGIGSQR
jgi:hypothetical protein